MIQVPQVFRDSLLRLAGESARGWLDALPENIETLCRHWKLKPDGPPRHGAMSLVLPVQAAEGPGMLKLSWLRDSHAAEVVALRAWNGRGAMKLFREDTPLAASLLERLDPQRSLESLEIGAALRVGGALLRRLAVPAPPGLPTLQDWATDFSRTLPVRWQAQDRPFSESLMTRSQALASGWGPKAESLIVHCDLWYGNVLAGTREPWLAIDPAVRSGSPEFGAARLLWPRLEDIEARPGVAGALDVLMRAGDLDPAATHAWTLLHTLDYWLWTLSVGLTLDPERCRRIVQVLEPPR